MTGQHESSIYQNDLLKGLSVWANDKFIGSLTDDSSNSAHSFTEGKNEILIDLKEKTRLGLMTLTSAETLSKKEFSWALYGLDADGYWTLIGKKTKEKWDDAKQTKLYDLKTRKKYSQLKLEIDTQDRLSVSELEVYDFSNAL